MFSKQYKCESCKANFISKESLERHMSTQGMYIGLLGMFFIHCIKKHWIVSNSGAAKLRVPGVHVHQLHLWQKRPKFAKIFAFFMAISVMQPLILAPCATLKFINSRRVLKTFLKTCRKRSQVIYHFANYFTIMKTLVQKMTPMITAPYSITNI